MDQLPLPVSRRTLCIATLFFLTAALCVAVWAQGPLEQDQAFHDFAETEAFGLAHFGNVVANAAYLLVGMLAWRRIEPVAVPPATKAALRAWALGFILVAAGSAWYHADPSDDTLAWDRAAMTVVFAAATAL